MKIYTAFTNADAIRFTAKLVEDFPVNLDKPNYIFCESKASLSFEKEISARLGGTFNTEVLSFSRYVSKNVSVDKYLSKAQAALAVRRIMLDIKDDIVKIKPNSFSIPKDVYELISQLKAALVKPCDLEEILEKEDGVFLAKLKDVALIFKAYEDFLKSSGLTDESNFLSLMPEIVLNDPKIRGARVVIAGVSSFTAQTVAIINALSKVCELDFVVVSGNAECFTNETYFKLKRLFPDAEVVACDSDLLEEAHHIALGLFEPSVLKSNKKGGEDGAHTKGRFATDKIKINQALDVREECMSIAKRIRYEVVNNGLRYRDFCVLCPSVTSYAPVLKECFNQFDIAYYIDASKTLDTSAVITLISGLIDVKRLALLPSSLIATAKNGFFCGEQDALIFEKYVKQNALSRKSIRQPFDDLIAESVRASFFDIYQKLPNRAKICDYVQILTQILVEIGFEARAEELCKKLEDIREDAHVDFIKSSVKAVYELFKQINDVLGQTTVDLSELKAIILSAAKAVEISSIPEYSDVVYIGDFKGGRLKKSKVVFATALTSSVPHFSADTALLNDRELTKMDGYRLIIEPKLEIVNRRERENIAVSLINFTNKLYLSYPLLDGKGKPTTVSEIINYFNSIFCRENGKDILIKTQDLGAEDSFINYMSKTAAITQASKQAERFRENKTNDVKMVAAFLAAANQPLKERALDVIESNRTESLFDNDLAFKGNFSATAIEKFFSCPYKQFAEGVLKLEEEETGDAKVYEWGNILHGVMENFIKRLADATDKNKVVSLADELTEQELKKPLYARYLNKSQYESIFKHIKIEARKECLRVYEDIKNSSFVPIGAELTFNESDKADFKPIILSTAAGPVKLRGKIDRVDRYKDYFRIIDYKSGSVEDSVEESFYTGRKIQLYLYMNVLLNSGLKPQGAYYYKLNDDYKDGGNVNAEFVGKTLEDLDVLKKADTKVGAENKSETLSVSVKNGAVYSSKRTLNAKGFQDYAKYALEISKSGANEMLKGMTLPTPYKGACDYCKLKGLCGYDNETGGRTRELSSINKETIFDALKGDDNG